MTNWLPRYSMTAGIVVCLLLPVSRASGQTGGAIAGTVTNPAGEPVAGASIQATNVDTKNIYKAESSDKGGFTLERLPPGTYELLVGAGGFKPYQQAPITIAAAMINISVRLEETLSLHTLGDAPAALLAVMRAKNAAQSGPTPRTSGGKPDLSGVWIPGDLSFLDQPSLLPGAAAQFKERTENNSRDYPATRCLPASAAPLLPPFLFKIVQTPALLIILTEFDFPGFLQVFLDGREHPVDLDPTWLGHSTGKWEGDTLVIDATGFNDKSWLNGQGYPHTERLHVTERLQRRDFAHMELDITIDDPGAYVKPWRIKKSADLALDEEIHEWMCTENNKDVEHMVGK